MAQNASKRALAPAPEVRRRGGVVTRQRRRRARDHGRRGLQLRRAPRAAAQGSAKRPRAAVEKGPRVRPPNVRHQRRRHGARRKPGLRVDRDRRRQRGSEWRGPRWPSQGRLLLSGLAVGRRETTLHRASFDRRAPRAPGKRCGCGADAPAQATRFERTRRAAHCYLG